MSNNSEKKNNSRDNDIPIISDEQDDINKFLEIMRAHDVLSKSSKCCSCDPSGQAAAAEEMADSCDGGLDALGIGGDRGEVQAWCLRITLEELYIGISKKLSIFQIRICSKCNGKGHIQNFFLFCVACRGTGKVEDCTSKQMQKICYGCNGTGMINTGGDRCHRCNGQKVVREKKVLRVIVEKGMQNGQIITLPGEGDEAVSCSSSRVTSDIVVVLQVKEHSMFTREGDDLFVEHKLLLTEALCGFKLVLTHLDDRKLLIKSNPGKVVKPDSIMVIDDEGMPMYLRPHRKGKMYIRFKVNFPDYLSRDQVKILEAVMPLRPLTHLTDIKLEEFEEITIYDVDNEKMQRVQWVGEDENVSVGDQCSRQS